ncbi:MAG: ATP-binding cassette domain-containing protein [Nocardioidaceae bacterium]
MIEWRDVCLTYDGQVAPALVVDHLRVEEAELVLVAGRTGSGKSTLLGTVNGLVPRFTGGHLDGDVLLAGQSIRGRSPRELAHLVGYVGQDPLAGFVTEAVEDELAYGMEQLGLDRQTMRRRVEETLDVLGIADLRSRSLSTLSGGQQQRVAIGAVLTMHPRLLVLDEPTSALDPTAAEDVLGVLARLVDDLGLTVLVAEHRMERVVPFADRLVLVEQGGVLGGDPALLLEDSLVAPPVVELGRLAGWRPLPLSVREARRRAPVLLEVLGAPPAVPVPAPAPTRLSATGIGVCYGRTVALRDVDLEVDAGRVVALMGRNGSGKSSLLWALQGSGRRDTGRVLVDGTDPAGVPPARARALVGLVPQTAADLLYLESVDAECAAADAQSAAEGTGPACRELLDRMVPGIDGRTHPRDLSEGQRLALVLALVLTPRPRLLALDEPTRGLDYAAKHALTAILAALCADGCTVLVATHDVEFVALVADEVVVLAAGEVVSAGATARVLAESPAFAPQTSKILGSGWLTVDQVRAVLA